MADPFYRYAAPSDTGGSVSWSSFPGYLSSDAPSLASHEILGSNDLRGVSSDFIKRDYQINPLRHGGHGLDAISGAQAHSKFGHGGLASEASLKAYPLQPGAHSLDEISGSRVNSEPRFGGLSSGASLKTYPLQHGAHGLDDISGARVAFEPGLGGLTSGASMKAYPSRPGAHGLDDVSGSRVHYEPDLGGLTSGTSIKGYPSLEDQIFLSQRQDARLGIATEIPDKISEMPTSLRNIDGSQVSGESNILFVDGLPTNCTRREVGHLFRPFIGFKEIRVVHKEPRHSGDRAMVLCFVEFIDSKCALTALKALQGYKFDDKKPDSPTLRIHFAHFPFRLPSDNEEPQIGVRR